MRTSAQLSSLRQEHVALGDFQRDGVDLGQHFRIQNASVAQIQQYFQVALIHIASRAPELFHQLLRCARVTGERKQKLHPGDVVNLGRRGAELRVAAIDDDEWRKWSNVDGYQRQGIQLQDMTDDQRTPGDGLSQSALSAKGYQLSRDIMYPMG